MRGWQGPQGEACKRAGRDKGESQMGSDREKEEEEPVGGWENSQ